MEYFGHYKASTTGQTGCVKEFVTTGSASMTFPPQVMYRCDLCKLEHGFRYMTGHVASTPKQRERLVRYCHDHDIELDVVV